MICSSNTVGMVVESNQVWRTLMCVFSTISLGTVFNRCLLVASSSSCSMRLSVNLERDRESPPVQDGTRVATTHRYQLLPEGCTGNVRPCCALGREDADEHDWRCPQCFLRHLRQTLPTCVSTYLNHGVQSVYDDPVAISVTEACCPCSMVRVERPAHGVWDCQH